MIVSKRKGNGCCFKFWVEKVNDCPWFGVGRHCQGGLFLNCDQYATRMPTFSPGAGLPFVDATARLPQSFVHRIQKSRPEYRSGLTVTV